MVFKNVLISVSNKTGLAELALKLEKDGARLVATGGTHIYLQEKGLKKVIRVEEQTGFPEVMDGRVRTLHPHIHIPLLARHWIQADQRLLQDKNLQAFDLLICNLYPFEKITQQKTDDRHVAEMIDIGGVALLRAAAKNFESLLTLCDPTDYDLILNKTSFSLEDRKSLSAKVFHHVSSYDAMIAQTLAPPDQVFPLMGKGGKKHFQLRYGENPHQKGSWLQNRGEAWGLHQARVIQGKPLSYNNLLDLQAAVKTLRTFEEKTTVVCIKHNNPCGIATHSSSLKAVELSLSADPTSVFGGIVALNTHLTVPIAQKLTSLFLEVIIAPDIEDQARQVLAKKKNLRVLIWPQMLEKKPKKLIGRDILGGYLLQSDEDIQPWSKSWQTFGDIPADKIREEVAFAWRAVAHLKSNAIAITADKQTLGLGMGQINRVDAVEHAITRWKKHHPQKKEGVILASDAFFPFTDSIEMAFKKGIRWIVQPGGSLKDQQILQKAEDLGVNLILTGQRHFLH